MNDNSHLRKLAKIPRCIQQLERTYAVMAMVLETNICHFV